MSHTIALKLQVLGRGASLEDGDRGDICSNIQNIVVELPKLS